METILSFLPGIVNFWFGFHYFKRAARKAFIPLHVLRAKAEREERLQEEKRKAEEAKKEAEGDPLIWNGTVDQAMKQLQACRSLFGQQQ